MILYEKTIRGWSIIRRIGLFCMLPYLANRIRSTSLINLFLIWFRNINQNRMHRGALNQYLKQKNMIWNCIKHSQWLWLWLSVIVQKFLDLDKVDKIWLFFLTEVWQVSNYWVGINLKCWSFSNEHPVNLPISKNYSACHHHEIITFYKHTT